MLARYWKQIRDVLSGRSWDDSPSEFSGTFLPDRDEPDRGPAILVHRLARLPFIFRDRGIYGRDGDHMPGRALAVVPELAEALVRREEDYPGVFRMSDLRRSPESSLRAIESGRGAQPPGYSQHNEGGAVDDDLTGSRKKGRPGNRDRLRDLGLVEFGRSGWKSVYDEINAGYDLHCFRRDGKLRREGWHYGVGILRFWQGERTMEAATERWIVDRRSAWWSAMDVRCVQVALSKLGLYGGAIDGIRGPKTVAGISAFQDKWRLRRGRRTRRGVADLHTKRVLAFISASVRISDWEDLRQPAPA